MGMENYNPPQEPWLVILYQDDHIMVVNKPSGLLSVPGRLEEHKDSVMTRIQRDYPQAESVHRLDMATSGVIVVALTKAAERELKRQFREREPKKQYVARVWGHPSPAEGLVDLPLICDWPNRPKQKVCYETGKPAQTEYEVVEYAADNTARVVLKPITGRSHQLRVHMLALGENGIIEGAKPGTVLIDMSSIAPLASREISEALKAKGIDMLDAPVSGGEPKAIDGTLSVMVGGDKAIFDKYYDLMKAMAGSVVHTGEIGAGNVTKLANQVIVALNIAAMSEALTLATKAGVNPDLVYQAIRGGLAGSTVLDAKAPMVMDRNFKPGFRIDLHIKDLANALDTSHGVGAQLPLTAAVMEMMQALRADGLGTADHSALACYYEKLAKVEVTR